MIQARVGEVSGVGLARTKKNAKQIAAKDVLEKLLTGPERSEWKVPNVPDEGALDYV